MAENMDKSYAIRTASRFNEALAGRGVRASRIILFGSYARGMQRDGSDIDIAVISGDFKGMDYWTRIDVLSKAIFEVFEPIEAVAFTPEEWDNGNSIIREYARDGVAIPLKAA
ncbi:MAG: nucleotidyltransferase domain-containing protein [Chitinispirillaceae bacterium]|jgi:predicted nucleotidyltransferase